MSSQLLEALASRGHQVTAIAPITRAGLDARALNGDSGSSLRERRFLMPYHENSPDSPQSAAYRRREHTLIAQALDEALAEERPDVLIVGRESFVHHVGQVTDVPRMLLVQGATIAGIVAGTYPKRLADRLLTAVREYDAIVTSAAPTQRTLAAAGVSGVHVIPNPVDTERFRPAPRSSALRRAFEIGEDDIVVTHASNLKTLKRPIDIVLAAEIALERNARLLFLIAGEGPCREAMVAECEARGLARRFRFTGWLDHYRIPEVMCSSEMVVMPSEIECQALVYLEAQACASVLVASDIPAAREVVEDGVTGMLFPRGDVEAMAATILACAGDLELRRAIGARARARVAAHALPGVAIAYERQLRSLVSTTV